MAAKLKFDLGQPYYRNTWKNVNGHIRVQLYPTLERARQASITSRGLFQEIGTPVHASQCLLNPLEVNNETF